MIIILLLVMVVALAVALSIVGRSINEISTSKKTEDSTRAFSAAEAGIEKVLKLTTPPPSPVTVSYSNLATASAQYYKLPEGINALEHPPIGKPSFAQFWFADPDKDISLPYGVPDAFYGVASGGLQPKTFNIYFGIPQNYTDARDKPAVEVDTVVWNSTGGTSRFESRRSWIETEEPAARGTNFTKCAFIDNSGTANEVVTNNNTVASKFYCKHTITYATASENVATSFGVYPVMARVRILFSSLNHPVAIGPAGGDPDDKLPLQADIYKSTGEAGEVQRVLQVFRQKDVMPHFFDFVLFSEAPIVK